MELLVLVGINMVFHQFDKVLQSVGLWNPAQVDAIFKIDKGVTDIICCFDQKGKWMTVKGVLRALQSQFIGNFGKESRLCLKKSKFFIADFFSGLNRNRCFWIFGKGTKCRIAEAKATRNTLPILGNDTKTIGISFKANQVLLLCFCKGADQNCASSRSKKIADGLFARMSKRGVANVMCQTSCCNNGSKIMWLIAMGDSQSRVFLDYGIPHCPSQTPSDNRHFQTMGESGVYKTRL